MCQTTVLVLCITFLPRCSRLIVSWSPRLLVSSHLPCSRFVCGVRWTCKSSRQALHKIWPTLNPYITPQHSTVKTQMIGVLWCFLFFWLSGGLSNSVFAVFLAPFLKWVILDYIQVAHGSFISVFTVINYRGNHTPRITRQRESTPCAPLQYLYILKSSLMLKNRLRSVNSLRLLIFTSKSPF